MERAVRARVAAGAYDGADGPRLAAELTKDLRAVSQDKHVRVGYSAEVLPPELEAPANGTPALTEEDRLRLARGNHGIAKLDVLKGNIGYLAFYYLAPPEAAADRYAAAMTYLADTEALILDLRECGGSISVDAIPTLCGYFFARPTHLNDIYWRPNNSTRQLWSAAHVAGKRYLDKPIYVLTSRRTFSGAEELAYDLKNLKRAAVIGETTGGGANPGGDRRADEHFTVWVPMGRAINPITKTNWEGVGVSPDVAVPAVRALHEAHLRAVKHTLAKAASGPWQAHLRQVLSEVERSAPVLKKVSFSLKGHPGAREVFVAGSFNGWAPDATPLTRQGDAWTAEIEVEPGRHSYKFIVDGEWMVDPANRETEKDREFVNSVRVVR
jgi:hypothetical protein